MPTFKFIGDPREGHEDDGPGQITFPALKLTFRRGEEVEVTDAAFAKKLRGNSHFEEVSPEPQAPEQSETTPADPVVQVHDDGGPSLRLQKRERQRKATA